MRVYISADIEGCTGLVSWSQCEGPGESKDWEFARRMMTHDVNAAIRGARAAGAKELVVRDAHAGCKNLLIDELEPGTELISGFCEGDMMTGFDASFDAAMLVGYHGMAGTIGGVMEHALAGGLHRFWINGQECGEILVSAAVAGSFGVPLVMVSSDEAGCKEAEAQVAGVKTAVTKHGLSRFSGRLLHPSITGPRIEEAAKTALAERSRLQPVQYGDLVHMRCQFRELALADLASQLENSTRVDGYTVEWTRPSYMDAHRAMYLIFNLAAAGRRSGD